MTPTQKLSESIGTAAHSPTLLHEHADSTKLSELKATSHVVDTIETQLAQLLQCRQAQRELSDDEALTLARERLKGESDAYGVWVYYPWRNTLVHLLPENEFRELRTNRNDHKITPAEQAVLGAMKIGVVGLSVGSASALTLVQEGIGGEIRLADFDTLELSNLNRVRATVLDLGLPKTVITARAIAELDPFVSVTIDGTGITDANLGTFLEGLDLLIEECDGLAMKLLLREHARARRIPVIMETSDRGMLDIERFDLEPERPLLHGLVGELSSEDLRGLSTYEKVPAVLRIIGASTLSARMGASMVDIDTNLTTWPQLASAVALGGALNAEAARRIALGSHTRSGRYYADFDSVFEASGDVVIPPPEPAVHAPLAPTVAPLITRSADAISDAEVEALVAFACLAPSGGNVQPWHFEWNGAALHVSVHPTRGKTLLDFRRLASHLAVGGALEYLEVGARAAGWRCRFDAHAGHTAVYFEAAELPATGEAERERLIGRVTDRRRIEGGPLSKDQTRALDVSLEGTGVRALWVDATPVVADVLAEGDRLRFFNETLHSEMFDEIRWSDEELRRRRNGLDLAALYLTPTEIAGLSLLRRRDVLETMRSLNMGQGLGKGTRDAVLESSAVVVLRGEGFETQDYERGGRALARFWAEASNAGLGMHPMTALPYMLMRLRAGGEGYAPEERASLDALCREYEALFGAGPDLFLARVFHADGPPSVRSPRFALEEVYRRV